MAIDEVKFGELIGAVGALVTADRSFSIPARLP